MNSDTWKRTTIAKIAELEDGVAGGPFGSDLVRSDYVPKGVPVIRGCNLSLGEKRFDASSFVFVSEEKAGTLARNQACPGDIIVTQRGTLGQVGVVPRKSTYDKYIISQSQMRLRCDPEKCSAEFMYYSLISPATRSHLASHAITTGVPHINLGIFQNAPVHLPPLPEQRAIAHVLGTLDDKIELNRRMNQTLEEMARTLFKSWFVDFDPVRAKAEGREPVGMDAETASLFSDGFEESELGPIPRGWKIKNIGDVTRVLRRGSQPKYTESDGVLVLNQRCIRDGRVDLDKARRHDLAKRAIDGRELSRLDVLINSTGVGTLGRVSIVPALSEIAIVDSHVTVARADESQILPIVFGIGLRLREREIEQLGEGSTGQTELSRKRLGKLPVIVPKLGIQDRLESLIAPLFKRAEGNDLEVVSLRAIRDSLLPRLLSGELRIADPEKFLEDRLP